MIVRLTFLGFLPGRADEVKKIYERDITPVLKQQKGSLGCKLLEPTDSADDYVSMTMWETEEDAIAYHSGGTYYELLSKVKNDLAKDAVVKFYVTENVMEPA